MFESTLPAPAAAPLISVSAFRRYLQASAHDAETAGGSTRLSALNPSLMVDLQRFEPPDRSGARLEALEVVAAAVRHGRRLRLHLQHESRVLPLDVLPAEGLMQSPLPLAELLAFNLAEWRVLHVEPARPDDPPSGPPLQAAPLAPLLWELALRGTREDLLPEIAGSAAYRLAPGASLSGLRLTASLADALVRLKRENRNLREISSWPGFDRGRAMRLLNALYLQAALMVSRTHPAATNEGWSAGDV